MTHPLTGLSTVNIELTSRCNKECWMCGRRKIDREYPDIALNYGDMDFALVESLAAQLPPNIVVQFHNNGEPLLYPRLGDALALFPEQVRCLDTNAKRLVEKAEEIIGNLDTLTISVIQDDPEGDAQHDLVRAFLDKRGDRKPSLVYRCLGEVDTARWEALPGLLVTRTLHSPLGSFKYKRQPTRPEIGVCLDFLHHMVGRKGYNAFMKITSTVTVVSGVLLVWENAAGNWLAWMGMGPGVVFSVGSVIGVMAYLLGMFLVNPRADRLAALGREMEAAEGPPSEIQHGELKRIAGEISVLGRAYFLLIALSLAMMAVARYWLF